MNESTTITNSQAASELDNILSEYKEPALSNEPTPSDIDAGLFGGKSSVTPKKEPFISHDPTLAPKQEFYKTGKKAGQPKPQKKGTAPPLNPAGQLSIQATTFITGAVFITMVDLLIPLFITGVYNWMQSRKKDGLTLEYEKLKMSPSQRNDLAVVGDAVVRELKISGSPTALFIMGLAGVYFMNFILQKSLAEKEALLKKQRDEKDNSKNHSLQNR